MFYQKFQRFCNEFHIHFSESLLFEDKYYGHRSYANNSSSCKNNFEHGLIKSVSRHHDYDVDQNKYLVCPDCSQFFSVNQKSSYETHLKHGKHWTCQHCDKKYDSISFNDGLFDHHVHALHGEDDLQCSQCDLKFVAEDTLRYR